jgi:hypothetical protein
MKLKNLCLLLFFFAGTAKGYSQGNWKTLCDVMYTDTMVYTNKGPVARPPVAIKLQQETVHSNRFRLVCPYKELYLAYGSTPRSLMDSLYLEFRLLPASFKVEGRKVGRTDMVYYSIVNTGCVTDINKDGTADTLFFRHPLTEDSLATVTGMKLNRVVAFQTSGYPRRINISPIYYFASNGNTAMQFDFTKKDHCITIDFPDLNERGEVIRKAEQAKSGQPESMKVFYTDGTTAVFQLERLLWDKLDISKVRRIIYFAGDEPDSVIEILPDDKWSNGNPMAGIKTGDMVRLYDGSGRQTAIFTYQDMAHLMKMLQMQRKGIYIVKASSSKFKISVP